MRSPINAVAAAKRLGHKSPHEWENRCHEIATLFVEQGLVEGDAVYGHYCGPIAENSTWSRYRRLGLARHGWIITKDGRIVDPTRWSFEGVEPYVFECDHPSDEYDEGGNRFREENLGPCPDEEEGDEIDLAAHLSQEALATVQILTGHKRFFKHQVFWLSNLPYERFVRDVHEIYGAIDAVGLRGFIPIDNVRRSEREAAAAS